MSRDDVKSAPSFAVTLSHRAPTGGFTVASTQATVDVVIHSPHTGQGRMSSIIAPSFGLVLVSLELGDLLTLGGCGPRAKLTLIFDAYLIVAFGT